MSAAISQVWKAKIDLVITFQNQNVQSRVVKDQHGVT